MHALIDGDVLIYRVGYTTETDPEWVARARVRESIGLILDITDATDYSIFLTDSRGNFRLSLFPQYKANRTQPKPVHYEYLSDLLVNEWGAEIAWGQEADDALGIVQTKLSGDSIICSIDKDLLQIPGRHFNFVKGEFHEVTPAEGLAKFYRQLLEGDASDNVTTSTGLSCPKMGSTKSMRALEGCRSEQEMFDVCCWLYYNGWKDDKPMDRLKLTGQLIKIRTKENEIWDFPYEPKPEAVLRQLYSKS